MPAPRIATEPLWDLVDESLEEAAFLWRRWEGELTSLTRSLHETYQWTEDRLHGALDGIRAAGDHVATLLGDDRGLLSEDTARRTVSAHLLSALSPPRARAVLADAVRSADENQLPHLARGMETAALDGTFSSVASVLGSLGPAHNATLCRLKAFRRAKPGREVEQAFESGSPAFQREALRAARYSAEPAHRKLITDAMKLDEPLVRQAAIESGLALGLPEAWAAARAVAKRLKPDSAALLPLVAMLGGPEEHQLVQAALRHDQLRPHAIFALGFVGTNEAAETCLAGMHNAALARMAGEAFCAITGADLERDGLAAAEPAEKPVVLEADDLDADLVPAPHDLWPLPDPESVRQHWEHNKARFAPGQRFLFGEPVSLASLVKVVEHGPMLRRTGILFELCARTSGRYDVESSAFARVQRDMMNAGRAALTAAVS